MTTPESNDRYETGDDVEFEFDDMVMLGWVADLRYRVLRVNASLEDWMRSHRFGTLCDRIGTEESPEIAELISSVIADDSGTIGQFVQENVVALTNEALRRQAEIQPRWEFDGPFPNCQRSRLVKDRSGRKRHLAALRIVTRYGLPMRAAHGQPDVVDLVAIGKIRNDAHAWTIVGYQGQLQEARLRRVDLAQLENEYRNVSSLVGGTTIAKIEQQINKVAVHDDIYVVIQGETGTGKELVAREIHRRCKRASKNFSAINCGAIPPTLIESVLFGHVKGAFSGADRDKRGVFEDAAGGFILVDEIGELPTDCQVKLLRVLQQKEFTRVGDTKSIKLNARVVFATNRDLKNEVGLGRFRADLFHRINDVTIQVPPLRERKEDLPQLVTHFIAVHKNLRRVDGIEPAALELLKHHHYAGNVRELEKAIRCALIRGEHDIILATDLPDDICDAAVPRSLRDGPTRAEPGSQSARCAKDQAWLATLNRALEATGGDIGPAAEMIGNNRSHVQRRAKALLAAYGSDVWGEFQMLRDWFNV